MSAATLTTADTKANIRAIRENASPTLVEFDEEAVRNVLIQSAARELAMVAESATGSLQDQTGAIHQSTADFDAIIARMSNVLGCAHDVEASVTEIVRDSQVTSQELETVSADAVAGNAIRGHRSARGHDQQNRRSIASAGSQCHDRGRTGGRNGKRLWRRGQRGQGIGRYHEGSQRKGSRYADPNQRRPRRSFEFRRAIGNGDAADDRDSQPRPRQSRQHRTGDDVLQRPVARVAR